MKYVICDPARSDKELPGFAVNDPLEGWTFTYLLSHATRFDSEDEARKALNAHYKGDRGRDLLVTPVTK
jgi:hypothetical protein